MGSGVGNNLWRVIAEKHPEIWDVIGGDPQAQVSLNPQPLPPRSAFLAGIVLEFTERMTLVADIADLIPRPGGERGIIIVGGHVARFVDDLCVSQLHVRWPLPWPAPPWFSDTLNGAGSHRHGHTVPTVGRDCDGPRSRPHFRRRSTRVAGSRSRKTGLSRKLPGQGRPLAGRAIATEFFSPGTPWRMCLCSRHADATREGETQFAARTAREARGR